MKIKFWLLDIAYTIEKGKPQIELWGIDERGNRILIIEKIFRPYFYAIPRKDANIDALTQQIKKLSTSKSPILKIEKVERKFFGKPLAALRLMCQNP
ncbi:MAG: DNA polymerase II, partial [Candidatus Baldrarchaeia archaeon]